MADLPDVLAHAVLAPGEWLVLWVDRHTDPEHLASISDAIPDELRGRILFIADDLEALPTVGDDVWCEAHGRITGPVDDPGSGRTLSNGCCIPQITDGGWCHDPQAACPGPHQTLIIGPEAQR